MDAELILDAQNATGESPVWSAQEQALYWVDIPAGRLHRWNADDESTQSWKAPQMLACIARYGDDSGDWIAGMENGLFRLTAEANGSLSSTPLIGVEHAQPGMRFNDGRCDRQGRFWSGTLYLDKPELRAEGSLYRYTREQGFSAPVVVESIEEKQGHSVFASAFLMIFLAEFGDKTQLAVAGMGSTTSGAAVWAGATLALAGTSIVAVIAGRKFLHRLPLVWIHRISGVFFLLLAGVAHSAGRGPRRPGCPGPGA